MEIIANCGLLLLISTRTSSELQLGDNAKLPQRKDRVEIMRAFVRLRALLSSHEDLARELRKLETKHDAQFKVVFDAIRKLMQPETDPKPRIGFGRNTE